MVQLSESKILTLTAFDAILEFILGFIIIMVSGGQ